MIKVEIVGGRLLLRLLENCRRGACCLLLERRVLSELHSPCSPFLRRWLPRLHIANELMKFQLDILLIHQLLRLARAALETAEAKAKVMGTGAGMVAGTGVCRLYTQAAVAALHCLALSALRNCQLDVVCPCPLQSRASENCKATAFVLSPLVQGELGCRMVTRWLRKRCW